MRLIDADKLLEEVGEIKVTEDVYKAIAKIYNTIKDAPTAYSVEKVVEEIMEQLGCKDCEYADTDSCACDMCIEIAVRDDVCEIIRKGGIDE